MKYVKKPIPVEAVKLPDLSERHSYEEWEKILPDWFINTMGLGIRADNEGKGAYVNTLEGKMFAEYGNCYIIRGPKGELYPCRADIFEETYEEYKE